MGEGGRGGGGEKKETLKKGKKDQKKEGQTLVASRKMKALPKGSLGKDQGIKKAAEGFEMEKE